MVTSLGESPIAIEGRAKDWAIGPRARWMARIEALAGPGRGSAHLLMGLAGAGKEGMCLCIFVPLYLWKGTKIQRYKGTWVISGTVGEQ